MKTNSLRTTILFGLLVAGLAQNNAMAASAQSQEIKVTGTIRPAACTALFGGSSNGEVDYGTISRAQLPPNANKKLETKTLNFSVNCDSPTHFGIQMSDNRSPTKVLGLASTASGGATGVGENSMYGLGDPGGKKIGAFRLAMKNFKGNGGNDLTYISSSEGDTSWSASNDGLQTGRMQSWRLASDTASAVAPGAFSSVTGELTVTAVLNKPELLPTGNAVVLDGSATLDLHYL